MRSKLPNINIIVLVWCILLCFPAPGTAQLHKQLSQDTLPGLPQGRAFSGMYTGASHEALLCMGGALSDSRMPGDRTAYSDQIYVLKPSATQWHAASVTLPRKAAFGVSLSYDDKVVLVGGKNAQGFIRAVCTVAYDNGMITVDSLPSLPYGLGEATGAVDGKILYVAGGRTNENHAPSKVFLALDLGALPLHWVELPGWPGPGRTFAAGASQDGAFFLLGGRGEALDGTGGTGFLHDGYKFVPVIRGGHLAGGNWTMLAAMPDNIVSGPDFAPAAGGSHLLYPCVVQNISSRGSDALASLMAYNSNADEWMSFGKLSVKIPPSVPVIPVATWAHKNVVFGSDANGAYPTQIVSFSEKLHFGWANWAALVIYLAFMVWLGFIYDKRGQTTDNFFTAGGRIPWWASGFSIYGSQLSAITFMAIPAIVFATDWSLAIGSFLILISVPIVVKYYVPFFRRLNITSAYEYLEHRFNKAVRLIGCISFILFQMGRMGVVLFLPAAAITSVTGIDIYVLIAIMGVICIAYTVMGGIEAVVWTDVAQVIILMGGAILCLFIAIFHINGGLHTVFHEGMAAHKFTLFHLGWSASNLTLWVCVVGFFFLNLIPYTSDQTVVQKYLTVKDEKQTAKSLWFNAIITMPATFIFFGLGTVLYVYYLKNPSVLPAAEVGNILPFFIVQQLPAGIGGLVIAGIFAASQSTLSSSMNSIAATYFSDIYQSFNPKADGRRTLSIARTITVLAGVFGTVSAALIAYYHVAFIFDLFSEILGILGGSLAGAFILGIFTRKCNAGGAISGIIGGLAFSLAVKWFTDLSPYLYGAVSVISCVVIGYLYSLVTPSGKDVSGLTYATLDQLKMADKPSGNTGV